MFTEVGLLALQLALIQAPGPPPRDAPPDAREPQAAGAAPDLPACRPTEPIACQGDGVVMCSETSEIEATDLARCTAPILWFSPDEPLEWRTLPQGMKEPLEDDRRHGYVKVEEGRALFVGEDRVVYWRVHKVFARKPEPQESPTPKQKVEDALARERVSLADIRSLVVSYYFYYQGDYGVGGHYHDLEGAEFELNVRRPPRPGPDSPYVLSLVRVTGFAHGSELMNNVLWVKPGSRWSRKGATDVHLPVTLLVEEGKHASCPDRNGDGAFTPGYDTNVRVSDAWGIRDVFGSGLMVSGYEAWMVKPRSSLHRVAAPLSSADVRLHDAHSSAGAYPEATYKLEPARLPPAPKKCDGAEIVSEPCIDGPGKCDYVDIFRSVSCNFVPPRVTASFNEYRETSRWNLLRYLAVGAHTDGQRWGGSLSAFSPQGLPYLAGWPGARVSVVHDDRDRDDRVLRARVDVFYSVSLSRPLDWYAAVGYDWDVRQQHYELQTPRTPSGVVARTRWEDGWAVEGGLQVRYRKLGLRLGVRSSVAGAKLVGARLVADLAVGPWPRHLKVE